MPLAISQPRGFEAAQKSKIQLEAVSTRSTSNVEIFTRRRPYFASSVAGAEAAQLGICCAMQADTKEEPSRRSKISTFESRTSICKIYSSAYRKGCKNNCDLACYSESSAF